MTRRNLFLLFFLCILTLKSFAQQTGQLLDRVVAIVNDDIILQSELNQRTQEAAQDLIARNVKVADQIQLQRKVLDKMIMEKIQLKRIKDRAIKVSDEALLSQIQEIAKNNQLTVLQLRDRLNQTQPQGFQKFRENLRQQMLFRQLQQVEILSKTQVTEDEIDNYLQRQNLANNAQEYHIGHIVINLPESATPEQRTTAKTKAEQLLQKIQQGEDFAQIAVRYSQGSKALQGGDLGWLSWDQIPTFFAQSIQDLSPNETSRIIRSPVGFHIIKLYGKRNKNSNMIKQYHLYRFILLSDDAIHKSEPPEALVALAATLNSLDAFETLNEKYSDIPASVNANGNLGWQTIQEMPLAYANAIQDLQPGKTARPFAIDQGWVLLYLDDTRQQDANSANRRQQAMEALRMKKANETYEIWLRRLKDEAIIDIRVPELKGDA